MQKQLDNQQWLRLSHSHGVDLGLKELMYYKAKARLLELAPKVKIRNSLTGQYLAPHKGRGMEFAEVRHYQHGDDIRSIDWRVTARTGETHTKLFQEEKERPVFVFTDFSNSMLFGSKLLLKSVQAAHISALVAWSACQRGDRIGGIVFNQHGHLELKPSAREKAVLKLCHNLCDSHHQALSQIDDVATNKLSDNLKRLNHLAKPGSLVYLVSDFSALDDASFKQLEILSRHCELIGCHISDPFEHQLPAFKQTVTVSANGSDFALPLMDKSFRDKFAKTAAQAFAARLERLTKSGLNLISFNAATPLELQLVRK
ncbi:MULTISPECIES: DUF58 domain-containing protein [Pseudoalteromonas]|uniref:DUF58 domain-containing protein n=1 Tax=Pseudoalteromonas haloplanktis TaxID=228 RepID=A0ABU1BEF9_PSEHA|nr:MULTISPECIES: DUF58 domain-containing protein [Pseudoalteromonas]MCF6145369.1 hypothetical protein [Pseudoalteromonas mariniglutinosa NCIMB 1770]MDQ9092883.1 DUF58 domain-containing protein [Pseudoalteromonas haloplanktis]TMN73592.1 DUF58 domain-containing protein [Pseudoalteromonas sp. S1727]BDF94903.1 hypothetical protein KAN5_17410 [Pseudoalteromonas sp. KAN5]